MRRRDSPARPAWQVSPPDLTDPACAPSSIFCSPDWGFVPVAQSCTPTNAPCDYSSGQCECAQNAPVPGWPWVWKCAAPVPVGQGSCTTIRPALGTPCRELGSTCDYGVCKLRGGNRQACLGWPGGAAPSSYGRWVDVPVECACPSSPPDSGASCSNFGLSCEYGSAAFGACGIFARCALSNSTTNATDTAPVGVWTVFVPDGGPPCAPAPQLISPDAWNRSCATSDASACPASFATVPRGASCDGGPAFCDYAEGRCQCAPSAGSPSRTWSCQDPPPLCPRPRPRLGTACTQEGRVCAYGSCGSADSETEMCRGAVWVALALDCSADAASLFGPIDAAAAP